MTYLEFTDLVRTFLTVDANRLGAETYVTNMIRQGIINVEHFIPIYRLGHESIYGIDDLAEEGYASQGIMPEAAELMDAYNSKVGNPYTRQPLSLYDWGNRFDLITGNIRIVGGQYYISINPDGRQFYVYPKISEGRQLSLFWNGIRLAFADADEVPFDEPMALCVAEYVTAQVERRINKDLVLYAAHYESYKEGLRQLHRTARARRKLSEVNDSISVEPACIPCGSTVSEPDDSTIEFAVFGDFGMDGPDEEAVADLVKSWEPDFIVWLGDANYPGGSPVGIQANILKYWDGYVPDFIYPAWGVHDLETSEDGQWGKPLLNLFPDIADINDDKLYYNFVKGEVEFFVLNSGYTSLDPREPDGITSGSTQGLWLQAAMAASDALWKVVVFHRAPYTSDVINAPGATEMRWPFGDWGADIVLTAHGHNYERLLVDGLTYIVAGLGGATKRGFGPITDGSQFRYSTEYGALRITADSERMQLMFYDVNGTVIDNITLHQPSE